jgi:hypothetical protein
MVNSGQLYSGFSHNNILFIVFNQTENNKQIVRSFKFDFPASAVSHVKICNDSDLIIPDIRVQWCGRRKSFLYGNFV